MWLYSPLKHCKLDTGFVSSSMPGWLSWQHWDNLSIKLCGTVGQNVTPPCPPVCELWLFIRHTRKQHPLASLNWAELKQLWWAIMDYAVSQRHSARVDRSAHALLHSKRKRMKESGKVRLTAYYVNAVVKERGEAERSEFISHTHTPLHH